MAGAWAKARELDREKEAQRKKDEEPLIAGPPSGAATILVPEDDAGDDEPIRDSDPGEGSGSVERGSGPRVRIVSEPFPDEKSPLVILEDKKKARRKKSEDEAKAGDAKAKAKAKLVAEEEEEEDEDERGDAKRARTRRATRPRPRSRRPFARSALAARRPTARKRPSRSPKAVADNDAPVVARRDAARRARRRARNRRRPRAARSRCNKPTEAGITIVDTSAALEKDAPTKADLKKAAKPVKGAKKAGFQLPSLDMLTPGKLEVGPLFDEEKLRKNAELLVKTLADYKITCKVEEILPGPVVTTYEVSPVAGTKVSKVAALADDLALALAKKVRIVAPIPGKTGSASSSRTRSACRSSSATSSRIAASRRSTCRCPSCSVATSSAIPSTRTSRACRTRSSPARRAPARASVST